MRPTMREEKLSLKIDKLHNHRTRKLQWTKLGDWTILGYYPLSIRFGSPLSLTTIKPPISACVQTATDTSLFVVQLTNLSVYRRIQRTYTNNWLLIREADSCERPHYLSDKCRVSDVCITSAYPNTLPTTSTSFIQALCHHTISRHYPPVNAVNKLTSAYYLHPRQSVSIFAYFYICLWLRPQSNTLIRGLMFY
jgi:hypothetical protein